MMAPAPAIETSCPVPLELLALLLRSDAARLAAAVGALPDARRAALAMYCFERYHMRRLGLAIALRCPEQALAAAGGSLGRQLAEFARDAAGTDGLPASGRGARPARRAA